MNKIILMSMSMIMSNILLAVDLTYNITDDTPTKVKYLIKDKKGIYNFPKNLNIFSKKVVDGSYSDNLLINGDLESGTNNWNLIDGSSFVVDTQSSVNNSGQYMWGSSTSGWIVQQKVDITNIPYAGYFLFDFTYSGWNSKDTIEGKVKFEDSDGNELPQVFKSGQRTGNKDDEFKPIQTISKSIPNTTNKIIIEVEEIRNRGYDADGYGDNFSIKVRPNKYYIGTSRNELITIPPFNKVTRYYASSGSDIIQPVDLNTLYSYSYSYGQGDNDFIIIPNGINNRAYGGGGDDVIYSFQGDSLISGTTINGGASDDKIYAPINGSNNIINGQTGVDTLVLRGNKEDYTITYLSDSEYTVSNDKVDINILNIEFLSFTNTNVMDTENKNTYKTEDLWYIDPNTNELTNIFPEEVDEKAKSVRKVEHNINITNTDSGKYKISITNIPRYITYIEDGNGNFITSIKEYKNGDDEVKRVATITLDSNSPTFKLVEEQNLRDTIENVNFDNMRITKKMGF